jgi:hypothetical protein
MTAAGGLALAMCTCASIAAPVAGATTYNNDTPIVIPTQGTANPYPSTITVSGTAGPITDVNLGFDGFTHGASFDVSIVLVAPSGQALQVLDCVGNTAAAGAFITLDDAATDFLPFVGTVSTGTFKPTSHCGRTRVFPAPGPLDTYGKPGTAGAVTLPSAFNGLSAIGTWKLYVFDEFADESGSIPGGWSLDVKPDVAPLSASNPTPTAGSSTKKCKKKKGKKSAAAAKKGCKKKRRK